MSLDTFVVLANQYNTETDALADYDAVRKLYTDTGIIDTYDAAVLTRKSNGKVEIVKRTEEPTRQGAARGFVVGLAVGAVIALFPAAGTEELAGTLCHEVSHTIHRDGVALMVKEQKIQEREVAAAILLGPTRAHIIAIALIGKLHQLGYSRDAESKADVTGSDICAEAGFNPWGLAWLFQDFQNADTSRLPQLLSDHPANGTRIRTLERHFQDNASTFSKFSRDPKSATPFSAPRDAPEVFLHADTKRGN